MRKVFIRLITLYQRTLSPDHPPTPRLRWARSGIIKVIELYQSTLSPDHGPLRDLHPYGYCRHHPTCSEYGKQVIAKKGVILGSLLLIKRLLSCHPWKKPDDRRMAHIIREKIA